MSKWNERNRIEPIPPKLGARETSPIAPETSRTGPEGKFPKELILTQHDKDMHSRTDQEKYPGLARKTLNAGRFAIELALAGTPQDKLDRPIPHLVETAHEASKEAVEAKKKREEVEQGMKQATKEATDKMHKGEIRDTPPTKPPEKPAEKAAEVSKAQAAKERVLAPEAKVVHTPAEPKGRPAQHLPGIREAVLSYKPKEDSSKQKESTTGKTGGKNPTKHEFVTPDQPKPKPTVQGPKM